MSSITVVCPNQRRYPVKVSPGILLHKVVEEACLKAGYDVAGVVAKNQNKIVDLALPFRLSGLPNNATIELSVSDKPKNENVELAIQLPDGQRQVASFATSSTLSEVLQQFSTLLNEDIFSIEDGVPSCVYMNRKYVGPELEHTTLTSMGISGGKCLLRYQKVEISQEDLDKLEEKASQERKRLASLSSTFSAAKKENEERDRLEAARLARFEAECKVREQEETKRREERMRELERKIREDQMEVDPPQPIDRDRLPEQAQNDSWSFDSPFAAQLEQPEVTRQPEQSSRLSQLNSLLERMDRSLSTGGSDNMVRAIADTGRMSLQQLTTAAETVNKESEPPARIFDDPCPRNVVVFARGEETTFSKVDEVAEEFFDVSVDDVKKMQRDLKNELKMQTHRSLIPRSFMEKKNKELKLEAWKHTVIRFIVGEQLVQTNFNSGEPVSRLFEEVATFFNAKVSFSLTAILNEPVTNSSDANLIEADLSPMCNLTVKMKGSYASLRADLTRVSHSEADTMSKEWLSVNTTYKRYTGLMVEEERPVKRTADMRDYQSGGAKPPAPSGPKWFKSK